MNDSNSELKGTHMKRTHNTGDALMGKLTRRDAVFAGAARDRKSVV